MPDIWGQSITFGGILLNDKITVTAKTKKGEQESEHSFGGLVISFRVPQVRPVQRILSALGPSLWFVTVPASVITENRAEATILVADPDTHKEAVTKFTDICGTNGVDALVYEISPATCANLSNRKKIIYTLDKPVLQVYQMEFSGRELPALIVGMSCVYASLSMDVQPVS